MNQTTYNAPEIHCPAEVAVEEIEVAQQDLNQPLLPPPGKKMNQTTYNAPGVHCPAVEEEPVQQQALVDAVLQAVPLVAAEAAGPAPCHNKSRTSALRKKGRLRHHAGHHALHHARHHSRHHSHIMGGITPGA